MSHSGRLERIQQFVRDNRETRRLATDDMNLRSLVIDSPQPLYGVGSFPSSPEEMDTLPIGTMVQFTRGDTTDSYPIIAVDIYDGGVGYTLQFPRKAGPFRKAWDIITQSASFVGVTSASLRPSNYVGTVHCVNIDTDWWSMADQALFVTATGALTTYGIGIPNMVGLDVLSGFPALAVRVFNEAWVPWWVAAMSAVPGLLSRQTIRNQLKLAGGAAVGGLVRRFGSSQYGAYATSPFPAVSLPLVSVTLIALWNYQHLTHVIYPLTMGPGTSTFSHAPTQSPSLLSDAGSMLREGGNLVRDAVVTLGSEIGEAAQNIVVGTARTVGQMGAGLIDELTPTELKQSMINTVSQGTKTIMLVCGGLIVIAVANSIRKVS